MIPPANEPNPAGIVVVSGLPRSGTSLMMKMLEAGGIPVLSDNERVADLDNPNGYYEFEDVKRLPDGDCSWLPAAQGRAVKVIVSLLRFLPPGYSYKVVFMRRSIDEVLASQRVMLRHRGGDGASADDDGLRQAFERHVREVSAWMREQPFIDHLDVDYNALLADPGPVLNSLGRFLGGRVDPAAMATAIDPRLYRQRATGTFDKAG